METMIFEKGWNMKNRLVIPKSGFQIEHRPIRLTCLIAGCRQVARLLFGLRRIALQRSTSNRMVMVRKKNSFNSCVCVSRNVIATIEFVYERTAHPIVWRTFTRYTMGSWRVWDYVLSLLSCLWLWDAMHSVSGHGIGSYFHGRPSILPYVRPACGTSDAQIWVVLKNGVSPKSPSVSIPRWPTLMV